MVYVYDRNKNLVGKYSTINKASKETGLTANEIVSLLQTCHTRKNLIFSSKQLIKK